jgi:hypothetical protein
VLGVAALGGEACAEVRTLAAAHLADVRARIADLRSMERILALAVRQCDAGQPATCPLIALRRTEEPRYGRARDGIGPSPDSAMPPPPSREGGTKTLSSFRGWYGASSLRMARLFLPVLDCDAIKSRFQGGRHASCGKSSHRRSVWCRESSQSYASPGVNSINQAISDG